MDIKLSKKQFKSLLELVHLGNWIVNSRNEPNAVDHKYEEVAGLIYSYGPEADLEEYIVYSKSSKAWAASNYLYQESYVAKMLEKYNEDTYWSSLVERFALKAFLNKYSAEKIKKMSSLERNRKILALIDKYKAATYDHNIDPFEMLKEIPVGR